MENKFSVVIPTLWQSDRIVKLINDLHECELVGEIILIDNTGELDKHSDKFFTTDKLRVYQPESNLFVAGSWNKGIEMVRYDYIALSNDDINFNTELFQDVLNKGLDGIVGQASENYHRSSDELLTYFQPLEGTRPWGWGCLMLFPKDKWVPVPNELRVWYNDDFINRYNPAPQYVLNGWRIETEMSTTSDQPIYNPIKQQDSQVWNNIVRQRG